MQPKKLNLQKSMVWGVIPHSSSSAVDLQLIILVSSYGLFEESHICLIHHVIKNSVVYFLYFAHTFSHHELFNLALSWNENEKLWFVNSFTLNELP
jgi:hypothetical protein